MTSYPGPGLKVFNAISYRGCRGLGQEGQNAAPSAATCSPHGALESPYLHRLLVGYILCLCSLSTQDVLLSNCNYSSAFKLAVLVLLRTSKQ